MRGVRITHGLGVAEPAGYRIGRPITRPALGPGGIAAAAAPIAALVSGWLIATGHQDVVIAYCAAIAALVIARWWPGPFVALMVLVIMNGVPVVDLSTRLVGSFGIQDCAVLALAGGLYWHRGEIVGGRERHVARIAAIWSACFFAWWVITFARSVLLYGIPVRYAAAYGRDFVYFALLLAFAVRARLPLRSMRQGAWLLTAGVVAFALGQLVSGLTGHELSWLVHPLQSNRTSGQLRIYSSMSDVVSTCLIFGVAWIVARHASRRRIPAAAALVTLLGVSVAFQLTRSNYAAMAVALVTGVAVYSIRGGSFTAVIVRVATAILIVAVFVIALGNANVGNSAIGGVATRVAERAESGVSDFANSSGSFGYRTQLDAKMLQVLGSQWPIGLGFLDPNVHYVAGLPEGSIRNSDVGVFNALMTMGVIGALLIYAPFLYGIVELLRAAQSRLRLGLLERRWIAYGGAAWIAWALVGSWNLVVLFSINGLAITALVLGWLAQATTMARAGIAK